MATTATIRLPEALKQRVDAAARKFSKTPHALMLLLIEQGIAQAEQRASFIAEALEADAEFERTRLGYDADEVHAYFESLGKGEKAKKPRLRKWPK